LIAELRKILDDAHRRLSPKSVMALAIAYIADVIAKIAADWPASRWDERTPWNWRPLTNAPNAQTA
jgi:hypothetical protein